MYTKNNNDNLKNLNKLLRTTKNKRMLLRYNVIKLHLRGYNNKNIANIFDIQQHTVGRYINAYKTYGLEGLMPIKPTGCPSHLSKEQQEILYEVISTKTPEEEEFEHRKNWTLNIIIQWIFITFNVKYSISGMCRVMHRLNLSYTRPTYTLKKADPKKQDDFKEDFEVLKKIY